METANIDLFADYPDLLNVPQLCEMLDINRNLAYKLITSGALPSLQIGRLRRILKQSVVDYLLAQTRSY